nr:MAG TPA: RapA N-terminal Tudor like domain [Caudoviricetes sp.]
MVEVELYNELQNIKGCLKIVDSQILELCKKKNDIMNDFLRLLPFQEGDKVKDKDGNIFIIERLKDAILLGKNKIKVHFLIRKIKKNGEPYQYANDAWRIDYFSLKKVVE